MASTTRAAAHLSLASTIAAGTVTYASPVRFENDGSFSWYDSGLDITVDASEQYYSGGGSIASYSYSFGYNDSYGSFTRLNIQGSSSLQILGLFGIVSDFDQGELIGPGSIGGWESTQTLSYRYEICNYGYDCDYRVLGLPVSGPDSYIGVRFSLEGATHYGWIGLRALSSRTYMPFAWGYETEAGVAIEAGSPVPGPSPLGVLAIGAAGALRGRRRG